MTDYFALLGESRSPWLDLESLKTRFHSLSASTHPDRAHSGSEADRAEATTRYAEFNAAYHCLREDKDRLLHLLELESGGKPRDVQRIPPGTMDLFVEVGQVCRDVDTHLSEQDKATSPLVKVQFFEKGLEWIDRLNQLQQAVNAKRDTLRDELRLMAPVFAAAPAIGTPERRTALPLPRLEEIYRVLSYTSRWTEQIRDRQVRLAM